MIKLVSVDLMDGKVVRLKGGNEKERQCYSDDPLSVAADILQKGFDGLHIVDLDAALGRGSNRGIILKILGLGFYKHVAGGLRDPADIEFYLSKGADRVVISTIAFTKPASVFLNFKDKIIISLDVKNGRVAIKGWKELTSEDLLGSIKKFLSLGFSKFIVTSIERDGTKEGFDRDLANMIPLEFRQRILIAGGVKLDELKEIERMGFFGAIIGRDFYDKFYGGSKC